MSVKIRKEHIFTDIIGNNRLKVTRFDFVCQKGKNSKGAEVGVKNQN